MFILKGRKAIVTGGGGGIGSAMGQALYDAGAQVMLVGRSESVDEAASKIGTIELPVQSARVDLGDPEKLTSGFKKCVDDLEGLDILAVCHGTLHIAEATDHGKDGWDKTINVNLTSVFSLNQLAGRHMIKQGSGKIINIASMYGMVSPDLNIYNDKYSANPPHYGSAKAALIQWTKYAACEFGREGIRFNSISPGPFPNKYVQKNDKNLVKNIEKKVPMNRIGQPEELVGALIFLAANSSSYVTGANIVVDGGWTAW